MDDEIIVPDIIAPATHEGVQQYGSRIIQLVIGIMERPYANAHYIEQIFESADELALVLEAAGFSGDGNQSAPLAKRAEPITTGDALKMAAQSGLRDLILSMFEIPEEND
jgi:hypothetical protein